MPRKSIKRKHVPLRTCVGCREILPKRNLIRIVRTPDGIKVDPSGKMTGRGAYLHDQRSCWDKGIRGTLAGALKTELTVDDRARLLAFAETLAQTTAQENAVVPTENAGANPKP